MSVRPKHQLPWVEGLLNRSVGRGLGDSPELGGWAILPLGQTIDLVVEQQDVDINVSAYGVDKVVSPDS